MPEPPITAAELAAILARAREAAPPDPRTATPGEIDEWRDWYVPLVFQVHTADVPRLIGEVERLAFLHDQDHKLADHWQQQLEALRAAVEAVLHHTTPTQALPDGQPGCWYCGGVAGHYAGCDYQALRALLPSEAARDG